MSASELTPQDWHVIHFAVDRLRMAAELPDPETNETVPLPEEDTLIRISQVARSKWWPELRGRANYSPLGKR